MSNGVLTPHETELLDLAVEFIKKSIATENKVPGHDAMRDYLHCGGHHVTNLRKYIFDNRLVEIPPDAELKEINEIDKDTWNIVLPRTRIHTLEELLEFCKVDKTIWEVERWEATKWEVGAKDNNNQIQVTPLYRVKACLRRKQFNTLTEYAKDNARLRQQNAKLKLQVKSEKELCDILARNHAGYDDLLANVKEYVNVLGDFSLPASKLVIPEPLVTPAVRNGHSEDAVLLLSDTHFGDQIRREDTSGFPEYDLVIAGNRMGYIIKKAKQVLTLHRAMYPLKRLYVWIGGDIGNGDLHDAPKSNALFLPAQVHFSYHMLKFGLQDLVELTVPDAKGNQVVEEIVLLFTVGNHMRMDEKMPTKLQAQRTLDWLIYQFIIERFRTTPRVTIKQEMAPYIFETIRGHRHLFAHGMQVGYKNSPDEQCKSMDKFIDKVRALFDSPEWRRKNGWDGETFARACIGDIHVPVEFPRLISNGSLNGQNELGVNWTLEPIPTGQQLFGVADKHLQTWKYFLECGHIQREKEDFNSYGTFAADYAERLGR